MNDVERGVRVLGYLAVSVAQFMDTGLAFKYFDLISTLSLHEAEKSQIKDLVLLESPSHNYKNKKFISELETIL